MKIYNAGIRAGKTTKILEHCHLTGSILWTYSYGEKDRLEKICREKGYNIKILTTVDILSRGGLNGLRDGRAVAVDNVDKILAYIANMPISAITATGEED